MSTEDTGTGAEGRPNASQQDSGSIPGSENGAGLGAGEPNTFEPEEGTDRSNGSPARDTSVATAEDTPDVEETPVETSEPS
jgi:hypothetical protein